MIKQVSGDFSSTVEAAKKALADNGFGVLTEIDVSATLKKKLDVEYPKTLILGACNPKLAHQALQFDADIATLMPCNVVVRENAEGQVEVAAINPEIGKTLTSDATMLEVLEQGTQKLRSALNALS
uniref:DUF302 domain-containing protein n=1 Tax=Magnetococcus massalia (strain MO-1) TaxID=451514 RepID=A0A1S7LD25_MAGMO|nr:Conserved protein of unknown function [Candidatus Magnetococcus massalia]